MMTKIRRSWSSEEKRALIDALKFSIIKNWRSDNGFRFGHHHFLEEQMKVAIPGTTLVAEPHIKSMVHVWKRQYGFLSGLLSKSGVSWNNIQKKVECTKESWDEKCKGYQAMANKMGDTWPFYEDWIEIFGKDRAVGDNSVNFVLAVNDVLKTNIEDNDTNADMPTNETVHPSSNPTEIGTSSFCDTTSGSSSNLTRNKRKATSSMADDGFMEVVSGLVAKTDETLLQIVKSLAPEKDDTNERRSLYGALDVFPNLTTAAKVAIGRKLAANKNEVEYFFSLPHEARLEFVTQLSRELQV